MMVSLLFLRPPERYPIRFQVGGADRMKLYKIEKRTAEHRISNIEHRSMESLREIFIEQAEYIINGR